MVAAGCAHSPGRPVALPPEVRGWTPSGPDARYSAETLYDYIDGGAEVYRAFNVREVLARQYAKPDAPDILADVFDMGTSEDAYGAYHHDMREGESPGIGRESEYMGGALAFWKGRYFVSIIAFDDTDDARRAVLGLGEAVDAAIPDDGGPPDIVQFLPRDGLLAQHVHYLHNHFSLNLHYFVAEENLLGLDQQTEGVLARYALPHAAGGESGDTPSVLLLIRYPGGPAAGKAYESFAAVYLPDADTDGNVKTENGKWTGARHRGRFVIIVFDAPSKADLELMTRNVTHNLGK